MKSSSSLSSSSPSLELQTCYGCDEVECGCGRPFAFVRRSLTGNVMVLGIAALTPWAASEATVHDACLGSFVLHWHQVVVL